MAISPNTKKYRTSNKMRKQEYIAIERTRQNYQKRPKQNKDNNLPGKKFKIMVIKILTELERIMEEYSENFKKTKDKKRTNES